ncbi:BamA/OMP85 family outer membrane protein [Veillonella sp. CAG:933]|uniref:BamA/OMP85 family outer membrane protein n=1 Tax=Veillonella sp. CAG:933 TaxID=1262980 RepID=UPI00034067AF|nr:BamA/TamA family outer membrane protein [Veillonella sp. CAG:933]CCX53314.1 outer membrane protein OMP85 family [Veillonella sp. CAG:933]
MMNKRAYKNMLAVAVVAALSGTTVWAADETSTATTQNSTAAVTAVSAQDQAAQDAITAARGGIEEAQKSDEQEAKRIELDNSSLATTDSAVLTVAKGEGARLEEQQAAGVQTAITTPDARYFSSVTDEQLQPYEDKVMTGFSIEGLPAEVQDEYMALLKSHIGDTLTPAAIKADISALGSSGYLSEINPVITVVPEGVKVAYKVTVNPVVKSVQFEGNTVYSNEMLVNYLNVQPNTVLNTVQVGERIQGINAAYNRDGYILARVNDMAVDQDGVLHISITEGIVEDIVPHGNKKTKDYVILREFNQKKGQPFNKFLVRRSVEKVYNLGYFDDVNVRLLEGSTPDKVVIEIDVLEHKTGTITLGAGYSDSDGFVGIVEVGEDNLRGTGDKIKVHWEFGGTAGYKNYSVSYLRPWIDSKGTSLGLTIFDREDTYTDYNSDGDEISQYVKTQKGINVSLGRQTGEYTRDYVTLETRKDGWKFDEDENSGYNYAAGPGTGTAEEKAAYPGYSWDNGDYDFAGKNYIENNFGRTNSVSWQKVYDSRDNIYDPKRGKRVSATVQWAGHGLGGDFDYYKFTGEYRNYKAIGNNQVIAFRARLGWAQGDVPYSALYTLGGADTLRGFEDDQFRGKKMYNATLEYRVPIFNKVTGVLFTDMGDAWDAPNVTWYDGDKSFNISVGAGVRISTPIGPIRLDYGVSKDDNKFHFSFGGQF